MEKRRSDGAAPLLNTPGDRPLAYLLTFTNYGNWLHGDARGSVDRAHSAYDSPTLGPNEVRRRSAIERMRGAAPVTITPPMRRVLSEAIAEVCEFRGWVLTAINVRTNHVHVVVEADERPEKVMQNLKARATRRAREQGFIGPTSKLWARHGSTRYLWTEADIENACRYVQEDQGPVLPGSINTEPPLETEPRL